MPATVTDFLTAFIAEAFDGTDGCLKRRAEPLLDEMAKTLLHLFDDREFLSAELQDQLPQALKQFFATTPRWFSVELFEESFEQLHVNLPDDAWEVVSPHLRIFSIGGKHRTGS